MQENTLKGIDNWTKDDRVWTRHHVSSHTILFGPEFVIVGPNATHLEDERVTTIRAADGEETAVSDNLTMKG